MSKTPGVTVHQQPYLGDDPLGFVIAANLRRRHLDESQRAMIAVRLANMRQGERTDLASIDARSDLATIEAVSQPRAADMMNVSRISVQRAAVVRERGIPELARRVERGDAWRCEAMRCVVRLI